MLLPLLWLLKSTKRRLIRVFGPINESSIQGGRTPLIVKVCGAVLEFYFLASGAAAIIVVFEVLRALAALESAWGSALTFVGFALASYLILGLTFVLFRVEAELNVLREYAPRLLRQINKRFFPVSRRHLAFAN